MGNYDQMAAAVSELSGGKNVVLLDDIGMPSIYVRIPKGKNSAALAIMFIMRLMWTVSRRPLFIILSIRILL